MVSDPIRRAVRGAARDWAPYVAFAAGVFLVAAFLGGLVGVEESQVPFAPLEVRGPGDPAPSLSAGALFVNNALVALWTVLSALFFGIPTLFIQVFNGLLLGSAATVAADRLGVVTAVLLLVPHGVIELPALWVAGAVGFRLTHAYWKIANGDRDRTSVPRLLGESALLFLGVLLALAVAAVIEATVTPALA